MKTYLTSGIAAALIASAAYVVPAAAQDTMMYNTMPRQGDAANLDDTDVDTTTTGSIRTYNGSDTYIDKSQDTGDYYEGVVRPQD